MADFVIFADNTIQVNRMIDDAVNQWLEESAGELEAQTKRNTAVGLVAGGKTKGDWSHYVSEAEQKAVIGNPDENAIWEEFGTGEYALHGDGRKGGWYIPIGDGEGMISEAVVQAYHFKVVYGKDGMRFAYTEGKRPKRAFENAKDACEQRIKNALLIKLKGLESK